MVRPLDGQHVCWRLAGIVQKRQVGGVLTCNPGFASHEHAGDVEPFGEHVARQRLDPGVVSDQGVAPLIAQANFYHSAAARGVADKPDAVGVQVVFENGMGLVEGVQLVEHEAHIIGENTHKNARRGQVLVAGCAFGQSVGVVEGDAPIGKTGDHCAIGVVGGNDDVAVAGECFHEIGVDCAEPSPTVDIEENRGGGCLFGKGSVGDGMALHQPQVAVHPAGEPRPFAEFGGEDIHVRIPGGGWLGGGFRRIPDLHHEFARVVGNVGGVAFFARWVNQVERRCPDCVGTAWGGHGGNGKRPRGEQAACDEKEQEGGGGGACFAAEPDGEGDGKDDKIERDKLPSPAFLPEMERKGEECCSPQPAPPGMEAFGERKRNDNENHDDGFDRTHGRISFVLVGAGAILACQGRMTSH